MLLWQSGRRRRGANVTIELEPTYNLGLLGAVEGVLAFGELFDDGPDSPELDIPAACRARPKYVGGNK